MRVRTSTSPQSSPFNSGAPTSPRSQRGADKLLENLEVLKDALVDDEAEAGAVNVYGVAILHSVVLRSGWGQAMWTTTALVLAFCTVTCVISVGLGTTYEKCLLDDDCKLGTVCVFLHEEDHFQGQSLCMDCNLVATWPGSKAPPRWLDYTSRLEGKPTTGFQFTPARTDDLWPRAKNAYDYCANQLSAPHVSPWANATNFDHCLYVEEALRRFGLLDFFVMMIAFVLVVCSIATDRQQQLFNQHLRLTLLPPPWRSGRALAFKLMEYVTSTLLSFVTLAFILLLFGGQNIDSTSLLLNGVAIAFVLLIDDELPAVLLSDDDQKAIDNFADASGNRFTLVMFKRKGMLHALVSFVALLAMFAASVSATCHELPQACIGISFLVPLVVRVLEEVLEMLTPPHVAPSPSMPPSHQQWRWTRGNMRAVAARLLDMAFDCMALLAVAVALVSFAYSLYTRELPLHHGKPINLLFLPKDMEPDVPGLFPNFPEAGKGGGGNFTPG